MKILLIGASGTIGRPVSEHLRRRHDVVSAGRTSGDLQVDLSSSDSILQMYKEAGLLDAVVCIAGEAKWGPFESLSEADFHIGLNHKLMGQVNLVRLGTVALCSGGSFTLSTGILADDPVCQTSSAALVNGALHSFVRAVALELRNGQRINAVSLGLVEDAVAKYERYFPGHNPVPMSKAVNAYLKSIEGHQTGSVIRCYENS